MGKRIILITGCSSGIGLDAARRLQARGWRVFASCRRAEDCARLQAEGLASPRIDYEDADSIANGLAEVLAASGGRLDALFNNGAHGLLGAVEDVPTEALRQIFESNLFGWHDLTRRVLPVMRAQGHGRILHCSSVLGLGAVRWRGAYVATKFALEGLADSLRLELRGSNIHVSLIEPGPITTDFRIKGRAYFERWIDWPASPHADHYRDHLLPRLNAAGVTPDPFERPPASVTAQVIRALDTRRPKARYYVTVPTHIMGLARRVLPVRLLDLLLARS
ncbi:SDR family NAD(P)-dependent oxidoreductase [Pseudooceanicola sp.]|uniref:SDR family NAD(P)-dependent oxidoreductase n=1 Tax=Pseudooceanicola sp. TaxID=1914328 RepID=UPI00260AAFE5|nr:SDR family NAD(P)-dependent oxidoreductase [Pseudooceanicola sp.]MDF1857069.1 SDR family NAD(P)-dependent oxidoreductase [Pseudooceanicola sp.]